MFQAGRGWGGGGPALPFLVLWSVVVRGICPSCRNAKRATPSPHEQGLCSCQTPSGPLSRLRRGAAGVRQLAHGPAGGCGPGRGGRGVPLGGRGGTQLRRHAHGPGPQLQASAAVLVVLVGGGSWGSDRNGHALTPCPAPRMLRRSAPHCAHTSTAQRSCLPPYPCIRCIQLPPHIRYSRPGHHPGWLNSSTGLSYPLAPLAYMRAMLRPSMSPTPA